MKLRISIIFILSLFLILINCQKTPTSYKAKDGILDLKNWDFNQNPVITLDGSWEFYWNGLYLPSELKSVKPNYQNLPSTWNDKEVEGQKLTGSGFATYRLKILLPDKNSYPTFAVRIKPLTNCKVFINEIELSCMGNVGTNEKEATPDTRFSFTTFTISNNTIDIVIQVSNFHHRKGGFLYNIYFGTEKNILEYVQNIRSRDDFILGFLFFVIIYHIGLYLIRKTETLSIQFTILVICVFLRTATTGEKLIVDLISVDYSIYVAIEYLTFYLVMPIGIQFLSNMFSITWTKPIFLLSYLIGIILSLITIFTKTIFYSNLINIYLPVFILQLVFAYVLLLFATYQKKENAYLILSGFTIMFICTINDILNTTEVIHTSYIAHYGLMAIVSCQSLYLLIRFVKAFQKIEILSTDLKSINEDLENRIAERTKEIMDEKIMAVKANELKDKFISLLSHDLRSPIGNAKMLILSSIEADKEFEKELSKNYLQMAMNSIDNSLEMTEKILQFSQTNSGNIALNVQPCFPSKIIDKVFNIMLSRVREKEIQLLNFVPEEVQIETDEALLQEVILNLVSNSIKFCNQGDMISVSSLQGDNKFILSVRDTGIGIPEELRAHLFSHTIKTTLRGTAGEAGTGLGLPLCEDIVKLLKGEIKLNDTFTKGTEFNVDLPLSIK